MIRVYVNISVRDKLLELLGGFCDFSIYFISVS